MEQSPAYDPIAACAQMVFDGDPDRFLATMTGTPEERKRLFVLYGFNLEIARAPFMSQEPMVSMIRLQFWRDVVVAATEGRQAPRHDVATALSDFVIQKQLDPELLLQMIEAREGDIHDPARQSEEEIRLYARHTAGALMLAASQLCHDDWDKISSAKTMAHKDVGEALGIANWLMSQKALSSAGRGYIAPKIETIQSLAQSGLGLYNAARKPLGRTGNPALISAWRTESILKQALKSPELAFEGLLGTSQFNRKGSLLWRSVMRTW